VANTPTLAEWQHLAVRTVALPSDASKLVEIEPVDLVDLLYGDDDMAPAIPTELAAIAEKIEFEGPLDLEKLSKEERQHATKFRHWLIANRMVSPKLAVKDVRKLPYVDQMHLFQVALHMDMEERRNLARFRDIERSGALDGRGTASSNGAKRASKDRL
jgi:hypothetical protein